MTTDTNQDFTSYAPHADNNQQSVESIAISKGHTGQIMRIYAGNAVNALRIVEDLDEEFIESAMRENGMVLIAQSGGLSASSATEAVNVLQEKGHITPEFSDQIKADLPRAIAAAAPAERAPQTHGR